MGDENFGAELRRLRIAAGWSLNDLADRIHYSKGYLSKVENGIAPPNAALAALCDAELRTAGALSAAVPRRRRRKNTARTFVARPAGLPGRTPLFVGRLAEIAGLVATLRDGRAGSPVVCAVDGIAGSGKTTLAVHVARQVEDDFPDGVLFLDLHAYTPGAPELGAAEALDRLLRQLGVPGDEIPPSADERAVLYRGCLRDRRVLVVIDNARAADQVIPLLPGEPACRLLTTSRNRLVALDDAHHVSLGPLAADEATSLFAAVAGPSRAPHDPDGEHLITRVIERCGRLPLAIRLAAARYQANTMWTPADLAARLDDRDSLFEELDDGTRSVYGAFRLSYEELPADQRRLLVHLALYPSGEIDAYLAAALAGQPMARARRLLEQLVTTHLVDGRPGGRFQCHDLVRLFADGIGRVDPAGTDRAAAIARMLDYALMTAENADGHVAPGRYRPATTYDDPPSTVREFPDSAAAMSWFDTEWPALVALVGLASEQGLCDRAWRLAFMLRGYFFTAKLWDPWLATHQVAHACAQAVGDSWAQAVSLNNMGVAHIDRGDIDAAEDCYAAAMPLFRELGDEHGMVATLANQGWACLYRGDHASALRDLTAAADFYRRTDSVRNTAITLRGMSLAHVELGNYPESLAHGSEALELCERLDLLLDATMALNCIGWAHFSSGSHDLAAQAYAQAVDMGERSHSSYEVARAMTGLGNIAAARDDLVLAQHHWDAAEELYPDLNTVTVGESRARHTRLR